MGVLTSSDPAEKTKKLSAEIANGRLAMMAITGMFFQDGLTGSAWGDWALYTASPLRAFESELGVQAPLGFWDPLGLSKDGDALAFRRLVSRRSSMAGSPCGRAWATSRRSTSSGLVSAPPPSSCPSETSRMA